VKLDGATYQPTILTGNMTDAQQDQQSIETSPERWLSSAKPSLGRSVGVRFVRLLGSGGMGEVYLVEPPELQSTMGLLSPHRWADC
jgi:hypothetical protein